MASKLQAGRINELFFILNIRSWDSQRIFFHIFFENISMKNEIQAILFLLVFCSSVYLLCATAFLTTATKKGGWVRFSKRKMLVSDFIILVHGWDGVCKDHLT